MGALLRGIKREQIRRGQILAAPGSIKAVEKFQAQIYVRLSIASTCTILIFLYKGLDQGRRRVILD